MYWMHALHSGVSDRRDRRRSEADAHRHCRSVHWMRAVPASLPRRLHRDAAGGPRWMPHWRAPARGARLVLFRACESLARPSLRVESAARPWFVKVYAALAADASPGVREGVRLERLRWRGGVL